MSHLFRSKKQRERDERRERRKAFRQAENAIDDVRERIRKLEKESAKQWNEARTATRAGEKEKARRLLQGYRASQVIATKLEQKRWVFEQYLVKMEAARSDEEFAGALASVNKVIRIDPERVEDVFDSAGELLGEQMDADRFWNRLYEKESGQAAENLEEHIPSMETLERQVEEEAALEGDRGSAKTAQALSERLGKTRERIGKILKDKE